jgi:hypothetical protein
MSDFLKIYPLGAELFYADGQANMTKVNVAFQSFAKAPKKTLPKSNVQHSSLNDTLSANINVKILCNVRRTLLAYR